MQLTVSGDCGKTKPSGGQLSYLFLCEIGNTLPLYYRLFLMEVWVYMNSIFLIPIKMMDSHEVCFYEY